jgi:MoxR-like ATPase
VSYPSFDEELQIVKRVANEVTESQPINRVLNPEQLLGLRRGVAELYVDDRLDRYIVSIIHASREPERYGLKGMVEWGASPRASIAMKVAARALAYLRGKAFVTPEEVKEIAPDVLRHRILPSFEAEARSITSGQIIETLLRSVTIP